METEKRHFPTIGEGRWSITVLRAFVGTLIRVVISLRFTHELLADTDGSCGLDECGAFLFCIPSRLRGDSENPSRQDVRPMLGVTHTIQCAEHRHCSRLH